MLYQIQTKYRDEARPRAGLIRVREFTMKDAYSFHESQEDLEAYYDRCHEAYVNVFRRVGMKNVLSIEADSGMMGGAISHEFMAVADCGEDTLFVSSDYRANREVATTALSFDKAEALPLERVETPGQKTIEEVSTFLGVAPSQTGKAVFYRDSDGGLVFAVIRGDLEVNEAKLRKVVQSVLVPATDAEIEAAGSVPGYASPIGIDPDQVRIVFDRSAAESSNLVVGGNEVDLHLKNFNFDREMAAVADKVVVTDIATARAGDPCPVTGEPLRMERGVEVGNIFQLGTKYSGSMGGNFLDSNGKSKPYIMGCYGIGVGRAAASVIEQSHDDYGPIWPITIAPYEVHIVALNYNKEVVSEAADALYGELRGDFDVLFDDRNRKAGFMFADADLVGVPFRVVVSPKTLRDGEVELKSRDGAVKERVAIADVPARLRALVDEAYAALA
jgi:prolyl-tRNA synthetase